MVQEQAALISELSAFLSRLGVRVNQAYLFGSRARGDYLNSSDVDLIIVSPDFAGQNFVERMVGVSRNWNGPLALEALCYTPEEFDSMRRKLTIVHEAMKNAIRIPA